jgi:hypothetical protein
LDLPTITYKENKKHSKILVKINHCETTQGSSIKDKLK